MDSPPRSQQEQQDQTDQVLNGLRTQMRLAADMPLQDERSPQAAVPPVRHFVSEMESRWHLMGAPGPGGLPILGRLVRYVKLAFHYAGRIALWTTVHQQIDFNATAVRFAQRVNRDLIDLNSITDGLAKEEAQRDRTTVDLQRDIGALKVLARQQQQRLDEAERQLATANEEISLLRHRLDAPRRPVAVSAMDGAPEPEPAPSRPSFDYYRFELRFRGPADQVREHFRQYVPIFAGASDVLDIGCGRGEFMELLREQGISSRGVDLDRDMVAACHDKHLDVVEEDALAYLRRQDNGSIGGAFTAQLVEHLAPAALIELIELLCRKLRPGAPLVVETINPQCLLAASSHFLIDLSHVRLVHPETVKFLLECGGVTQTEVRYASPVPDAVQLEGIAWPGDNGPLDLISAAHNRNMGKLNSFLYGYQDYAVVARKDRVLRTGD